MDPLGGSSDQTRGNPFAPFIATTAWAWRRTKTSHAPLTFVLRVIAIVLLPVVFAVEIVVVALLLVVWLWFWAQNKMLSTPNDPARRSSDDRTPK